MRNKRSNRKGIILMALGVLFLIGAGSYIFINAIEETNALKLTEYAQEVLSSEIPYYSSPTDTDDNLETEEISNVSTEMQTIAIDGTYYIGILDIPVLDLSLPIIEEWSYENLNISPSRYMGSYLDDSLIIAAHNFNKHFGMIYLLEIGDKIYFTDVTGVRYEYEVILVDTLAGTDVEEMEQGDWDLTLFTCTVGGVSRVTVRCQRVD